MAVNNKNNLEFSLNPNIIEETKKKQKEQVSKAFTPGGQLELRGVTLQEKTENKQSLTDANSKLNPNIVEDTNQNRREQVANAFSLKAPSQTNITKEKSKDKNDWLKSVDYVLEKRGYVPEGLKKYILKAPDGTVLGEIGHRAKLAVEKDDFDKYFPESDEEKNLIEQYKKMLSYKIYDKEGKEIGTIGYDAKQAFLKGELNTYVPKDINEKKTIDAYKKEYSDQQKLTVADINDQIKVLEADKKKYNEYAQSQEYDKAVRRYEAAGRSGWAGTTKEAEEKLFAEAQKKFDYYQTLDAKINVLKNDKKILEAFERYDIDIANFDLKALEKWAEENNMEDSPFLSGDAGGYGSKIGPNGEKLAKKQAEEDYKVFEYYLDLKSTEDFAKNHPLLATITDLATVPLKSVVDGVALVEDLVNVASGKEINLMSPAKKLQTDSSVIRSEGAEYVGNLFGGEDNPKAAEVGKQLYVSTVGILDSAIRMYTGAAIAKGANLGPKATSAIVRGLGFTTNVESTIIDGKKRGLSDARALATGLAAGTAEVLTEKFSIDEILKEPATAGKALLRSFLAEGTEEGASNVLTLVADELINQGNSKVRQDIANYLKEDGATVEEAVKKAYTGVYAETLLAMSAGGFAGMAMSGVNMAVNSIFDTNALGKYLKKNVGADVVANMAGEFSEATKTAKQSVNIIEKINNNKKVSDHEVGALYKTMAKEMENTPVESLFNDSSSGFATVFDKVKDADTNTKLWVLATAKKAETSLNGQKKTLVEASNAAWNLGKATANMIVKEFGETNAESTLYGINLAALSNPKGFDINARIVADVVANAIQENDKQLYKILSKQSKDVSELIYGAYVGAIKAEGELNDVVNKFTAIMDKVYTIGKNAHSKVYFEGSTVNNSESADTTFTPPYGEAVPYSEISAGIQQTTPTTAKSETPVMETSAPTTAQTINLKRVGNFYEVYGSEAVALAQALDMETDKVNVNGVATDMLRLPANLMVQAAETMGDEFNFNFSDRASVETTNTSAENVSDTTEADIAVVVDAINKTLRDGALEEIYASMEKQSVTPDISVWAKRLIEVYKKDGDINRWSGYFTDGGAKVISTIESTMDTTADTKETVSKTENVETNEGANNIRYSVAKSKEVLQNQEKNDIIDSKKSTVLKSAGEENGIEQSGKTIENDERHSKVQVEKKRKTVQNRSLDRQDSKSSEIQLHRRRNKSVSRRIEQVEHRQLEQLVETVEFQNLSRNIGDKMSAMLYNELSENKYGNDSRLDEGYEFSDVVTYDILANDENELRTLFADEIAEYFNQNNSADIDSTGMTILKSVLTKLKNSIVRNEKGQLIPLYHATDKDFDKFEVGDIGYHFGSYSQAHQLASAKKILENARFIKAYLNITNPLVIEHDNNLWNATQIVRDLVDNGIIDEEQGVELIRSTKDTATKNAEIREILRTLRYDGIIYKNEYESGYADSYIVFDDSQIIRIESEENANEQRSGSVYEDGKRANNESARKQTERLLSFRRKNQGKDATERRNIARELIERGQVEEVNEKYGIYDFAYSLVKPEAYNDDMLAMVEDGKKNGKEVVFFVGEAKCDIELDENATVTKEFDGIAIGSEKILIRYDGDESPQTLYKHEYCHSMWTTPAMQKIKNKIINSLSPETKQAILSEERYADYMEALNNKDDAWQEFVCDVMAGMNDYTADYIDVVENFWNANKKAGGYNPSSYAESTDAGGSVSEGVNDNVRLSLNWRTDLNRTQYKQVEKWIRQVKNHDEKRITDTASWYKGRINGDDLFVIYSTEIANNPTILYEVKGKQARIEQDILTDILEEEEYGESINGKSSFTQRVSKGNWVQNVNNSQNNLGNLGSGQNNRNVGVLQGQSQRNGSPAFWSVLKNLFEIQERGQSSTEEGLNNGIKLSISKDSDGKNLTKAQQEYFNDSKVRDENGNLLVMYQGASEDFTVFDRKKSSYANLYGRGFYFTKSENHAKQYGDIRAYYLNINHPVSTTETTITKAQLRKFLQAVIENEDYSFENYGYDATVDSVLQSTYGKSDFLMLNDVSQTAIGDLVEAVELFNEVNGTDYDGIMLDTETVTFNSEQAKLTSNENPTSDPDIRFSFTKPVEETKDLVAVHNLWEEKLLKSLKLGGLPMPSIAVVRAREGHSNFGDISLVFRKDTISPTDRRNKVYSGDAWTPTYPHIEYKINTKAQEEIEKKIDALVPRDVQKTLGTLYLDADNMTDTLNRSSDIVSVYRNKYAMKYAFLKDTGVEIDLPMKDASLSSGGNRSDEAIIKVAETVPDEVLRKVIDGENIDVRYESEPAIRKAVTEAIQEKYKDKPVVAKALMPKEELSLGQLIGYAEDALRYKEEGIKQEVDYKKASGLIDEKTDSAKYEKWLKELFSNIVAKEGIRNDKDLFTPSGNRRSFEALHYEHTLENVVKAMKESGSIGIGGFGGNTILGSSAVEYGSISEIKEKANERMKSLPQEEYDKIRQGFNDRFFELASGLPIHKDSFSAIDDAANMLCEAVMKYKTKSGMANYLRSESKGWANYSEHIVDDLIELVNDIRNMPTSYFEAKPQRAVSFDEIAVAIIPDDVSEELKTKLTENNVMYVEYESGNNNARIDALNSIEDVKFSFAKDSVTDSLDTQKKLESIAENIDSHGDLIELAKQNTREFVSQIRENKSLQKRLANAKRQMLLSPTPAVNPVKVGKITKEVLSEVDSTLKATDLKDRIMNIYNEYFAEIKKAKGVKSKTEDANMNLFNKFSELAVEIANSSQTFVESEDYALLKSYVRNTRIKVPDHAKNEAHYAEFRKSHMGTFNLTNDGLDIDIAYNELCGMFPHLFDAEVTSPADQLYAIADALEKTKPYAYNPSEEFVQDAIGHIVYRFVSETDGLAVMPKTKAQKIAEKGAFDKEMALEKERTTFEQKFEKQKAKSEDTIRKLQKKINDADYVRYWEKRLSKEEKAKALKDLREKRDIAILKSKIRNIVSDMKKNLDKSEKAGGYPRELVQAAADVCSAIDFHTGRTNKDGTPTKASLKLDALKMQYDALKNNPNYDFASEHSEILSGMIENLHNKVNGKRVSDLNFAEISELKDILSEISHRLYDARKQIGIENARENAAIGSEIINSINSKSDVISSAKYQWLREMKLFGQKAKSFVLNPHRVNEAIALYDHDSAWWKLYDMINRGSRKAAKFTMDANKPFDELVDGGANEIAFYDFRTKKVKTGIKYMDGTDVEIPKSIVCELVMAWERKQGRGHLEANGAKIPDMELYNKGKTRVAITDGGKITRPITQIDIDRLKSMLDSYDLEWMSKADDLFNKVGKDAINETSMELLGRELATAENYIRLYVDEDFVAREIDGERVNATLESHGSLKETKPGAKQTIVLRGLHENVYDHIDFVSKYYGLAIPIRNFNKVYNMSLNIDGDTLSVRGLIGKKFGSDIRNNVVEQFIRDLQAPRAKNIEPFGKIRGNWLTATFWANIRSTLKQTTSYWTASAIVGEDSLVKGLAEYTKHSKQTRAEIAKYSGTLYKRAQGLSTTELGDRANRKRLAGASNKLTKFINEHAPVLRKIPEGIRPGNWLQSMDCSVAAALWEACKVEVAKTTDVSDDGYFKAVTDMYERVIEETQSNYDVAHRPEALKNTNVIVRTVTMFQTDNLQQSGIIYNALGDYQTKAKAFEKDNSLENQKAKEEAKTRLAKAVRSRVYSSLWLAFVTMLGDMLLRKFKPYIDDEEKDITAQSVLKRMMLNMCEEMFGVFVPVAGELIGNAADTFTNGYDFLTEPSFDAIQDFIKATSKVWKGVSEGEWEDVKKALVDAIPSVSNITGVAAKNIIDIFNAVEGYVGDVKMGDFAHDITDYTSGSKSFYSYGDLASCIVSGNKEKETKILDYYSANDKKIAKASLTKEIKPAYVSLFVEEPLKASAIQKKLVAEYGYDANNISNWVYDAYLDELITNADYAEDIILAAEKAGFDVSEWAIEEKAKKKYKTLYKEGEQEDAKKAYASQLHIDEETFASWENEVDESNKKSEPNNTESDVKSSLFDNGDLANAILSGNGKQEEKILEYFEYNEKTPSKNTLTKTLKPEYVSLLVNDTAKASELRKKLVLEYDYSTDTINNWVYDVYFDSFETNANYSDEIKSVASDAGVDFSQATIQKKAKTSYKTYYKEGKSELVKDLFVSRCKTPYSTLDGWEKEVDKANQKAETKRQQEIESLD